MAGVLLCALSIKSLLTGGGKISQARPGNRFFEIPFSSDPVGPKHDTRSEWAFVITIPNFHAMSVWVLKFYSFCLTDSCQNYIDLSRVF